MTKLLQKSKTITSAQFSIKPSEVRTKCLSVLSDAFSNLGIEYFVVGAAARDLIMENVFGIRSPRATLDVDIAIFIENWDEFYMVRRYLEKHHHYQDVNNSIHRLQSALYGKLDMIPFGGIEGGSRQADWPPEYSTIIDLTGFKEAFADAVRIEVIPQTFVQVASLAGLALLKLNAWAERTHLSKDAHDLAFIMLNYIDAGNSERFYEEESDLLIENFDYACASARLLGRDIVSLIKKEHRNKFLNFIVSKLQPECIDRFVGVVQNNFARYGDDYDGAKNLITSFYCGIKDRIER